MLSVRYVLHVVLQIKITRLNRYLSPGGVRLPTDFGERMDLCVEAEVDRSYGDFCHQSLDNGGHGNHDLAAHQQLRKCI